MSNNVRLAMLVGFCAGLGLESAYALDCPAPLPIDGSAIPTVSPEIQQKLSSPDVYDRIPEIFAAMRALYPNASKTAIANYLIASFCPIVNARPGVIEDLKRARLGSFADGVVAAAY